VEEDTRERRRLYVSIVCWREDANDLMGAWEDGNWVLEEEGV
jgi:hypothetical protein